jgi:WD40 repeat protein
VRALAMFDDDVLVSAGNDASLKFWNISNGQYLRNIENATKSIISSMILISDDTFATGSDDGSIIIWKN